MVQYCLSLVTFGHLAFRILKLGHVVELLSGIDCLLFRISILSTFQFQIDWPVWWELMSFVSWSKLVMWWYWSSETVEFCHPTLKVIFIICSTVLCLLFGLCPIMIAYKVFLVISWSLSTSLSQRYDILNLQSHDSPGLIMWRVSLVSSLRIQILGALTWVIVWVGVCSIWLENQLTSYQECNSLSASDWVKFICSSVKFGHFVYWS